MAEVAVAVAGGGCMVYGVGLPCPEPEMIDQWPSNINDTIMFSYKYFSRCEECALLRLR